MADLESDIDSLDLLPEKIPLAREDSWKKQGIHATVIRNYLIYFLIDEAKHQVYIVRIIYEKRDQAQVDYKL